MQGGKEKGHFLVAVGADGAPSHFMIPTRNVKTRIFQSGATLQDIVHVVCLQALKVHACTAHVKFQKKLLLVVQRGKYH